MSIKDINKTKTSAKEILAAELFESISHPTRIRILKTLANGERGFSKLKSILGFSSSGNLSHHLNKLESLIQTNNKGNYELTDQGREALISIGIFRSFDPDWIRHANAIIMTLLLYSTITTVRLFLGNSIEGFSILLSGLIYGPICYFVMLKINPQRKPIWPYKEK